MIQPRARRTRDELLVAAAEAFETSGYIGTSMADVASRLGKSKGSLSYHFPSKGELAQAVVEAQYNRWPLLLEQLHNDGLRGLRSMLALSFQVAAGFRDDVIVRAGIRLELESISVDVPLPIPYVAWIQMVTRMIREAQDDGDIPASINAEDSAWTIVAAFFGIQQVSDRLSHRTDLLDRIQQMWQLLLPGLGFPDPTPLLKAARDYTPIIVASTA